MVSLSRFEKLKAKPEQSVPCMVWLLAPAGGAGVVTFDLWFTTAAIANPVSPDPGVAVQLLEQAHRTELGAALLERQDDIALCQVRCVLSSVGACVTGRVVDLARRNDYLQRGPALIGLRREPYSPV